jgi:hypothetical protein
VAENLPAARAIYIRSDAQMLLAIMSRSSPVGRLVDCRHGSLFAAELQPALLRPPSGLADRLALPCDLMLLGLSSSNFGFFFVCSSGAGAERQGWATRGEGKLLAIQQFPL